MQFPVQVSNKKDASIIETVEEKNKNNTTDSSQNIVFNSIDVRESEVTLPKEYQEGNPAIHSNDSNHTNLDQTSNMTMCEHSDDLTDNTEIAHNNFNGMEEIDNHLNHLSKKDSGKLELLENFDNDVTLLGMFKTFSLERFHSWDDSGFNSCTSGDDRDDLSSSSGRSSFDLTVLADDEDDGRHPSITKKFPNEIRHRSYSLDSESSDLSSDSNCQCSRSKMNLHFNNYSSLRNLRESKYDCCCILREQLKSAFCDINKSDINYGASIPKQKSNMRDPNNNRTDRHSILKNLKIYKGRSPPFSKAGLHNKRGLWSIIICIIYTLFFGAVISICGIVLHIIKKRE